MKKIGTVTFHSSYNFGSNLQAYALQEYIKHLCVEECDYKIINLRTYKQKEMYKDCFQLRGIKNYIKRVMLFNFKKQFSNRRLKFENFISNYLNITDEFISFDEVESANLNFDYYISGSDQLWNLNAFDFDWTYFLEFVNKGRKISYSASFGPKEQVWDNEQRKRISSALKSYDYISVREYGSYQNVKSIINVESNINIDPTLLFSCDEWCEMLPIDRVITGDYIFLYDLSNKKDVLKIAKYVSKKFKMPVVVSKFANMRFHFSNFKKCYDCGPIEFLGLIKYSKFVLSSSFHGNVFAILFHKNFFAINGDRDFRISNLLNKLGLDDRTINLKNVDEKCNCAFDKIDFKKADEILNVERKKTKKYLVDSLEIKCRK